MQQQYETLRISGGHVTRVSGDAGDLPLRPQGRECSLGTQPNARERAVHVEIAEARVPERRRMPEWRSVLERKRQFPLVRLEPGNEFLRLLRAHPDIGIHASSLRAEYGEIDGRSLDVEEVNPMVLGNRLRRRMNESHRRAEGDRVRHAFNLAHH
jgi:hypothetical protein